MKNSKEKSEPKIYLDYVPQNSRLAVKNNKCKYDAETHQMVCIR